MCRLPRSVVWLFTCLLWCGVVYGQAAPRATGPITIEERSVPVATPEAWPGGDWRPVPRADYDRFRKLQRKPSENAREVRLSEVVYEGVYDRGRITRGTLTATIAKRLTSDELLSLSPLNITLKSLRFENRRAIWGTTGDDRIAVLIGRQDRTLFGSWSFDGEPLVAGAEFDVQTAPATISRIVLTLPVGFELAATVGEVTAPEPNSSEPERWTIDLGSRTRTRLTVTPIASGAVRRLVPLTLAEVNTDAVLSRDGFRFSTRVQFEVFDRPLGTLELRIPKEAEIESVLFGTDLPLRWRLRTRGGTRLLHLTLPEPLLGRSRQIRVLGRMPYRPNLTVPVPRPVAATLERGRFVIEVVHPLVLEKLDTTGLRQAGTVAKEANNEIYTFDQLGDEAQIQVLSNRPPPAITTDAVYVVEFGDPDWTLEAEWSLSARTGSSTELAATLPEGWELTSARLVQPKRAEGGTVLDWRSETVNRSDTKNRSDTSGEGVRLRIPLPTTLTPKRPLRIRLTARRLPVLNDDPVPVPLPLPDNTEVARSALVLVGRPNLTPWMIDRQRWRNHSRTGPVAVATSRSDLWLTAPVVFAEQAVRLVSTDRRPTATVRLLQTETTDEGAKDSAATPSVPEAPSTGRTPAADRLELSTRIGNALSGEFRHDAVYHWRGGVGIAGALWVRLPDDAVLTTVSQTIGDQQPLPLDYRIRPDGRVYLEPVGTLEPTAIRLTFRSPSPQTPGFLFAQPVTLPVPETTFPVGLFSWRVTLPETMRISTEPAGIHIVRQPEPIAWPERLFGPLGRAGERWFDPVRVSSWKRLFGGASQTGPDRTTIYEFESARVPTRLAFELWERESARRWGLFLTAAACILSLLTRYFQLPYRSWLAGASLAGTFSLALCLPLTIGCLAGAMFSGVLLASLLPRRFVRSRRVPDLRTNSLMEPGSTTERPSPGEGSDIASTIATTGLAILLLFPLGSFAQREAPTPSSKTGTRADETAIVLVPEETSDVVYVSPALERRITGEVAAEREASPSYLVSSARYEAELDEQNFVALRANYRVSTLHDDRTVTLRFPFANVNFGANACTVDGIPTAVYPEPNGEGVRIDIPPVPPSEVLWAPRPYAVAKTREVKFLMYPRPREQGDGGLVRLAVPPVSDSELVWTTALEMPVLSVRDDDGERMTQREAKRLETPIGWSDEIVLSWSRTEQPIALPTQFEAVANELLTVHRNRIDAQVHVRYTVSQGNADHVVWRIPSAAIVREVRAEGLRNITKSPVRGNASRLLIEFESPSVDADGSRTIDLFARLTLPNMATERVTMPPLFYGGDTDSGSAIKLSSIQRAVQIPPLYRAEFANTERTDIVPVSPTEWGGALLAKNSSSPRQPERVWRSTTPFRTTVTLRDLEPSKEATIRARGTISEEYLNWVWTAEIDTAEAPAYQHRLHVDADLWIDAISVKEDRAERLLRWSRSGNRVTLVLQTSTTGRQRVELQGRLPIRQDGTCPLPRLWLEAAPDAVPRVELVHEPGVRVEVIPPGNLVGATRPDGTRLETVPVTGAEIPVGTFVWTAPKRKPVLSIERRPPVIEFDHLIEVRPSVGPRSELTSSLVFLPDPDIPSELKVRCSIVLPEDLDIDCEGGIAYLSVDGQGTWLTVFPDPTATRTRVSFAPFDRTTDDKRLTLPEWSADGVRVRNTYLALPNPSRFDWSGTFERVLREELPAMLSKLVPEARRILWLSGEGELRWTADEEPAALEAPFWETTGQQDGDVWLMRTRGLVLHPGTDQVSFVLPSGAELDSLRIDGESAEFIRDEDRLDVNVPGEVVLSEVVIDWRRDRSPQGGWLGQATWTLPGLAHAAPEFVLLRLDDGSAIRHLFGGWMRPEENHTELLRLQALLDATTGLDPSPIVQRIRHRVRVQTDALLASPEVMASRERADRVRSLVVQLQGLGVDSEPEATTETATPTDRTELSQVGLLQGGGVAIGRRGPQVISLWWLRLRPILATAAVLLTLVLTLLTVRLLDPRLRDWFERHARFSLMLLGLLWWMVLRFGAVGLSLAIIAATVAVGVRVRRWYFSHTPEDPETAPPSSIIGSSIASPSASSRNSSSRNSSLRNPSS